MEISNSRVFAAEVVGTAVLMLGGPGSAILAGDRIGTLGIAFAFGFSLLVMAYAIGHVTGCNINPAVTLGMVLTRKLTWAQAVFYWVGQFVGAAIGGLVIYAIANNIEGFSSKNNFAANGWDQYSPGGYGVVAAMFVEVVFTALLVYVVLATTSRPLPRRLRRAGRRSRAGPDPHGDHPGRQHLGQPGPQLRVGAVRRP